MAKSPSKGNTGRPRQPGKYLVAGRVVRPHGVRGEILVEGSPELLASLVPGKTIYVGDNHTLMEIVAIRPHQDRYLISLPGVANREQADRLRAAEICIETADAEALDPGAYYHWQILGLDVATDLGEVLGKVTRIIETGANDVYVVGREGERDLLIPAITSVIRSLDLEAGVITVTLIEGLREIQE